MTYLGGGSDDEGYGIALDTAGNAYVTGSIQSSGLATAGAWQTTYGGGNSDAFVAKFNSTDGSMAYCTYLGGANDDAANGIAVDSAGNAYVTGCTYSSGLATAGAYQTTYKGGLDVFVAKLNAAGSGLVYFTYLGGTDDEEGQAIAVDKAGCAYVTGYMNSSGMGTPGAYMTTQVDSGSRWAFVAKINPTGSGLAYFTYLAGRLAMDYTYNCGNGIAVDAAGNAYVTGTTDFIDPGTAGAYQTAYGGGIEDAFVAKFNSTGSGLIYFTYLGGSGSDGANGIAVDSSGNAYVIGYTDSSGLATAGVYQTTIGGGQDAFVAKLNAAGSGLAYFTYLGGTGYETGFGIAIDTAGDAYVTGSTESLGLPTAGAYQTTFAGSWDAYVAKLSANGSGLTYFTYLGGYEGDTGYGIAVNGFGNPYIVGTTDSWDLATTAGAGQTAFGGSYDAFAAKVFLVPECADLTGVLGTTWTLPASRIAGSPLAGFASVVVSNLGNVALPTGQRVNIQIVARDTTHPTNPDTVLTTLSNQSVSGMPAGGSATFYPYVSRPAGLSADSYQILANIVPVQSLTESDSANNTVKVTATGTTKAVAVAMTFVDLSGSLGNIWTLPGSAIAGHSLSGTVSIAVRNLGNAALAIGQQVTIQFIARDLTNPSNPDITLTTLSNQSVSGLAANGSKTFSASIHLQAGLPAGRYEILANIVPVQALTESNLANNVVRLTATGLHKTILAF